jgi:hypothetical protein
VDTFDLAGWRSALIEGLDRSFIRNRLPLAIVGIGCIHLVCFLICQMLYDPRGGVDVRFPMTWLGELAAILVWLRKSLGKSWIRSSLAINLIAKFWTTFLILSFNLLTLNAMTGFDNGWYKPVWSTLSTFFFASMGWVLSPWFFIPAVQMWATGLLMNRFAHWAFLIYGASWWLALAGIAVWLHRNQRPTAQD